MRRKVAIEMQKIFDKVDLMLVPSLRDEILTITNHTGHPALVVRAGFVEVGEARSDWAPDPANPMPKFSPPRRVPHGICLLGRMFDEGTVGRAGIALERVDVSELQKAEGAVTCCSIVFRDAAPA